MTRLQKKRIEYLRRKGDSYAAIAADLCISANTVKSHCRRKNLGVGYIAELSAQPENVCCKLQQTARTYAESET